MRSLTSTNSTSFWFNYKERQDDDEVSYLKAVVSYSLFWTYNFLLLFKRHNLCIQLLQSIFQVFLMLQNGNLVFFLNCKLHFPDLESFLELVSFILHVDPSFFLLSARLVALV